MAAGRIGPAAHKAAIPSPLHNLHMTLLSPFRALTLALASMAAWPTWGGTSPPAVADFPQFADAAALTTQCHRGLQSAHAALRRMERVPADARWLPAMDAFNAELDDLGNRVQFLSAVHPDKTIRDAAEACELKWNDFASSLRQNPKLFAALRSLKPRDPAERELRTTLMAVAEDAGVGLPPAQRARAKQLMDRINALGQAFDRNIRDEGLRVAFAESELAGVPPGVWQSAPRNAQGLVMLGVDRPTYSAVTELAESAAARERMWRARTNEGGQANLDLLGEITRLRTSYARLFGLDSWSAFVLRRKMAETPEKAQRFLADVQAAVAPRERKELEELRQAKAQHLALPLASVKLDRWDLGFYTERLRRERFAVDQEAFRAYFPPQASLAFALRLIEQLMGVRYQRVPDAKAWHPEVQTYVVSDASSGQTLGSLLVDLYPRDGKYNHAAVWGMAESSVALRRPSQAVLVVNFNREGLTLDELETLLHELGHAVHHNLSSTRFNLQAGTTVKHDFVEAPSQMLEDWVYDPAVLGLFAQVCPACKPVPAELIAKAKAARQFGTGVDTARQQLYAAYDLALYGAKTQDPMALWAQMEAATPLGFAEGTMFPAGFSHIASNYGAGYYGYLWSLVLATDLRTAFGANKLDATVGRRYRETVLAPGSSRPPQDLVRAFLGRDFNAKAFYEELQR
jgi:thimet oligopeptidase